MSDCNIACPNCDNKKVQVSDDTKPIPYTMIQCLECGCFIQPAIFWLELEELNDFRMDAGLPPMTEQAFLNISREFDEFVEG